MMVRTEFHYAEYPPPADTRPWVLSLWSFRADRAPLPGESPYTVWADGCVSLGVILSRGHGTIPFCVGPRVEAMRPPVQARTAVWGVRLRPDAAAGTLGVAPGSLRNHVGPPVGRVADAVAACAVEMGPLDGTEDRALHRMEALAREVTSDVPLPEPRVRAAVAAIVASRGEPGMVGVARDAGISLRQLQRLFRNHTGLTLREYGRVRRLREALARSLMDGSQGWSRVAADTGFVDHAHLTREFVTLTGLPPSRAMRQMGRTTHAGVTP